MHRSIIFSFIYMIIGFNKTSFSMDEKKYKLLHVCYLYDDSENSLIKNSIKTFRVTDFYKKNNIIGFTQNIYYTPTKLFSFISDIFPCCLQSPKKKASIAYVVLSLNTNSPNNYVHKKKATIIEKNALQKISQTKASYFCYNGNSITGPLILDKDRKNALWEQRIKIDAHSNDDSLVIGKLFEPSRFYLWKNKSRGEEMMVLEPLQELYALNEVLSTISKIIFFDNKTVLVFLNNGAVLKIAV